MQNSINPITNAQVILERLNMDVRRPFENCLANDLVNEFDYGRFGVVGVQLVRGFAFLKARLLFRISSNVSAPIP